MKQSNGKLFALAVLLIIFAALRLLGSVLTPFLIGTLLAYLFNPVVNKLVKLKIPRLLSIIITFVLMLSILILLIVLIVPLIETQITTLTNILPDIILWLKTTLNLNSDLINVGSLKTMLTENWDKAGGTLEWLLKTTLHSGIRVIESLMDLLLIPVVAFYLLCDWDLLLRGLRNTLPRRIEPTVVKLVIECHEVLSEFFRGQLLVMLALGVIYSAGLALIGLQIGLLIGLVAGLLCIVPYLGFIIGIVAASIAASMQFGTITSVILVWIVFLIAHVIDHAFLTPKLVGNRIGLHPVAVIFAILAGGSLFGFVGVLLALPVAALIMVWVRFFYKRYQSSELYQA